MSIRKSIVGQLCVVALAVVCCLLLGGCVFSPAKFGGRGIVMPGCGQYDQYLANCCKMSPALAGICQERGNPEAIKIGHSGGYFVWKDPPLLMSVGMFGNTSSTTRIPRDLRAYVGYAAERNNDAKMSFDSAGAQDVASVPAGQAKKSSTSTAGMTVDRNAYSVERFERVTGDEFSYVFKIVFVATNGVGISAGQRVKRELRTAIEDDYRAACPDARGESVQIDFPVFSMKGCVVEGRAEITRIAVTALTYDGDMQKGVISVRIGASSFEKARAWVRKNIETIVRDKNIALTTGKVPADKRFFLGTERVLDGNILQIEFETE